MSHTPTPWCWAEVWHDEKASDQGVEFHRTPEAAQLAKAEFEAVGGKAEIVPLYALEGWEDPADVGEVVAAFREFLEAAEHRAPNFLSDISESGLYARVIDVLGRAP